MAGTNIVHMYFAAFSAINSYTVVKTKTNEDMVIYKSNTMYDMQ